MNSWFSTSPFAAPARLKYGWALRLITVGLLASAAKSSQSESSTS